MEKQQEQQSSMVEAYLKGNYTSIFDLDVDDGHVQSSMMQEPTPPWRRSMQQCNHAVANFELESYRACLRDCQAAIAFDPTNLRAYHLQGLAYLHLHRRQEASQSWREGMEVAKKGGKEIDLWIVRELKTCLQDLRKEVKSSTASGAMMEVDRTDDAAINTAAVATSPTLSTSSPSTLSLSSTTSSSNDLEAYIASCQIPRHTLIAVRSSLTNASGIPLLDDGIALGYLLVNTAKYRDALHLFTLLLQREPKLVAARLGRGSAYALLQKWEEGIEEFSQAITLKPQEADAWKRRGQTRSAAGDLSGAYQDLTKAIELAMENGQEEDEIDSHVQRGMLLHKMKNHKQALVDLYYSINKHKAKEAQQGKLGSLALSQTSCPPPSLAQQQQQQQQQLKLAWNFVGLCEGNLGNVSSAVMAYNKALEIDPALKEAMLNKAQIFREYGLGLPEEKDGKGQGNGGIEVALQTFQSTLPLDPSFVQAYYLYGLCLYGLGRCREAVEVFCSGLRVDPTDRLIRHHLALSYQAMGRFREAVQHYHHLLPPSPPPPSSPSSSYNALAIYHHEFAIYLWSKLDTPFTPFNLDRDLLPRFKEGWCKGGGGGVGDLQMTSTGKDAPSTFHQQQPEPSLVPTTIPVDLAAFYNTTSTIENTKTEGEANSPPNEIIFLIDLTKSWSQWIQLRQCPGFLENQRQHRMCGLAALEIAQTVQAHWLDLKEGGRGVLVPEATCPSPSASMNRGTRPLGWREVFEIAVRWRQLVDPNDPVFWIDGLQPQSFAEGFGLQTPIINGQLKVIRYYPYFERSFELMKSLSSVNGKLDEDDGEEGEGAVERLHQFYQSVQHQQHTERSTRSSSSGNDNGTRVAEGNGEKEGKEGEGGEGFWVVTPCHSQVVPDRVLEGTRLTVVPHPPNGYEFTIRTPGTPPRWAQYDQELTHLWTTLTEAFENEEEDPDVYADLILSIFYYWCNFAPLTRGSAACGYIVMLGLFMASGMCPTGLLKESMQLDWEAILQPKASVFVEQTREWMYSMLSAFEIDQDQWPVVSEVINTPRKMLMALNWERDPKGSGR